MLPLQLFNLMPYFGISMFTNFQDFYVFLIFRIFTFRIIFTLGMISFGKSLWRLFFLQDFNKQVSRVLILSIRLLLQFTDLLLFFEFTAVNLPS
jgi:hypothetical protein